MQLVVPQKLQVLKAFGMLTVLGMLKDFRGLPVKVLGVLKVFGILRF